LLNVVSETKLNRIGSSTMIEADDGEIDPVFQPGFGRAIPARMANVFHHLPAERKTAET